MLPEMAGQARPQRLLAVPGSHRLGVGVEEIGNHRMPVSPHQVGDHFVGRFWRAPPPPLSGARLRFHDGFRSLAGCAAATSPAVPELDLLFLLFVQDMAMPAEPTSLRGIHVPDATLVGRFSR